MQFLSVYGIVDSAVFQQCSEAAAYVNAKYPDLYNVTVNLETPVDFYRRRDTLIASGVAAATEESVATVNTGDVAVADMAVLVVDEKRNTACTGEAFVAALVRDTTYRPTSLPAEHADSYTNRAHRTYLQFLRDNGNRYCWMDVRRGDVELGRVIFELFSKVVPHTSQNFWRLCRGDGGDVAPSEATGGEAVNLSYEGTRFFRILQDAWVMAGDVTGEHGGNGGHSCYGRFFPDECFTVPHDAPGVLGMCNDGAHSSASSFYITRKKMSWMNGKYVAFGRVIEGMDVVDAIHDTPVKHNQAPAVDVVISACGVIDVTQ